MFRIERTGVPEDRLGGSHRFRVTVLLADRPFETFLLDVGFRPDTIVTDLVSTADMLAFAGIASVAVRTLPLEYQVAEKVHAYTRAYAGDQPSSRVKDLVDIALIAGLRALDSQRLGDAIESTFTRRNTHELGAVGYGNHWCSGARRLLEAAVAAVAQERYKRASQPAEDRLTRMVDGCLTVAEGRLPKVRDVPDPIVSALTPVEAQTAAEARRAR